MYDVIETTRRLDKLCDDIMLARSMYMQMMKGLDNLPHGHDRTMEFYEEINTRFVSYMTWTADEISAVRGVMVFLAELTDKIPGREKLFNVPFAQNFHDGETISITGPIYVRVTVERGERVRLSLNASVSYNRGDSAFEGEVKLMSWESGKFVSVPPSVHVNKAAKFITSYAVWASVVSTMIGMPNDPIRIVGNVGYSDETTEMRIAGVASWVRESVS